MVSIIDNKLTIQFEANTFDEEDVIYFINSIIWHFSHIDADSYNEVYNYYMLEILKAFIPESEHLKIPKIKTII